MKAIVVREFGSPDVMKLEDVPEPKPGPGQVAIRVHAAGVNPVDTYVRAGAYARKPNLPYTPGTDIGGTVHAIGNNVTRVKVGDRVYGIGAIGGYAEIALCEDWQVFSLPQAASFAQGAAIGVPYATAWRGLLMRAQARPGESVLVHGASGGVGTAAVQIARAMGMRVIGTAGSEEGMALVRRQGAHHVLNHREPDYLQKVPALAGGQGVDVILEMLANVNLDRDLDVIALHGRVVVIGNRGRIEIDPRKTMGRDASILGMTLFNATRADLEEIHAGIVAGLENGALKPVIGKEMPLADAAQAHVAVMDSGAMGKIVLVP
jgi:NADPH2:quinone reductase